jgi:DNA-binding NtrC family response regulator/tetratricopeptide (TPR) repeat protein
MNQRRLVADRFVTDDVETAIDLATGAPVLLHVGTAGGASEQLRWTLRCDRWRALEHRAFAPLVDFGLTSEYSRFEAWDCGARWHSAGDEERNVRDAAEHFLRVAGLTIATELAAAVHVRGAGPVIVPDMGTGYPNGSVGPIERALAFEDRGISLIPRPAVAALSEMLEQRDRCRSRIAVLWGPAGSGKKTVARELARIARLNGFVPISARLLEAPHVDLWRGRSLFVIALDGTPAAWNAALQSTLRSPRPHVVLIVSDREHRGIDGVRLAPVDVAALASAVYPPTEDPVQVRRIQRAALRARGLPGRFVESLWHPYELDRSASSRRLVNRGLRVAESSVVYGNDVVSDAPRTAIAPVWGVPDELRNLRERLDGAVTMIDRGRHAPGLRQLRHAIGGLARRADWDRAAEGTLHLASCLLGRGRPRDAQAALDEARQYAGRVHRESLLVDIATLTGEAWIDLARLDEAESVLATAVASARGAADHGRQVMATIALSRCLYWRGHYAEAAATLAAVREPAVRPHALRAELLAARIAIGQGEYDEATSGAAAALASARATGDARGTAAALYCAALVRTSVGDLDAADGDLTAAIGAARSAHDPLRAVRARLLQVEVDRRRGRRGAAAAQMERVARLARSLPPLLRARVDVLRATAEADGHQIGDRVSRHVAATGLGALALYAGRDRRDRSASEPIAALAHEIVAIVQACQTADDEAVVLKDVCARVRRQTRAAAVAFVAGPIQRYAVLASDGSRLDASTAERCITTGITIAPHRHVDRIESSVPVRYGGGPIAALCARWTLGSTYDIGRAAASMELAAAAAAPIVAGFLGRRETHARIGTELLGVTALMSDLRRSVERAAAAPFAVLIEGESGSGKELVARAIHRLGVRRDRTFAILNCAAMPDDLVEAELFGHTRGAFTGAIAERAGVFEEAHGGTLFLDEIGELSPRAQAKVLRVIQEGELRRVGENLPRRVDVRIVAATNRDLAQDVEAGKFRADLWYRLDVIRISVPPLRDRREDIVVLADRFWREASQRVGGKAALGAGTVAALTRYDWPGNVRELQNVLAALAVRSPRRGVVPPTALPPQFACRDADGGGWRFSEARRAFEERFVRAALVRNGGHRGQAAAELGLSRQGLTKLMARLGIAQDEGGTPGAARIGA